MAWQKFIYEFVVRETDLDSYGHMNNATYLRHFEDARWEFTTKMGRGYREVHQLQQGPIILEVSVKFKKEVRLRQKVRIETQMAELKGKIGQVRQEMKAEDGEVLCEALFTVGIFDFRTRKLMEPTRDWLDVLGYQD